MQGAATMTRWFFAGLIVALLSGCAEDVPVSRDYAPRILAMGDSLLARS